MAAMATATLSTLTYLIHHFRLHSKSTSRVYLLLRPFSVSVLTRQSSYHDKRRFPSISSSLPVALPRPYSSISHSFSCLRESEQAEVNVSVASPGENNGEDQYSKEEGSDRTLVSMTENGRSSEEMMTESSEWKLSVKEKKKLSSYAHSLGDKLKCQLVGKSGVTEAVVVSFLETLEKNELLKVKIHRTCPGELEDMILHLEEATGSVSVGQIGRTVILYRPSPTKLKGEEKESQRR